MTYHVIKYRARKYRFYLTKKGEWAANPGKAFLFRSKTDVFEAVPINQKFKIEEICWKQRGAPDG